MDEIRISVIIPVYNVENYLKECLDSIVSQTLEEIEIICVDDGSTDGSAAILREYAGRDSRVRVLTQANAGQGTARNVAMDQAAGEYVYCMDADDRLEKTALAELWQQCREKALDVLYFSGRSFYEEPQLEKEFPWFSTAYQRKGDYPHVLSGRELFVRFLQEGDYYASPCLYLTRLAFLRERRIRFPEGIAHEDEFFALDVLMLAERAACVPAAYFHRRVRSNSTMTSAVAVRDCKAYLTLFWTIDTRLESLGSGWQPEQLAAFGSYQETALNLARKAFLKADPSDSVPEERLSQALVSDWCQEHKKAEKHDRDLQQVRTWLSESHAQRDELKAKLKQTYQEKYDRSMEIKDLKMELGRMRWRQGEDRRKLDEEREKRKALEEEKKTLQTRLQVIEVQEKTISDQKNALEAREKTIHDLKQTLKTQENTIQKLKKDMKAQEKALKGRLKRIKSSLSYRLGRRLTWPVRALRRLLSRK